MKIVAASGDDWDEHIDAVLFGYRVNAQASTKFTPFELLYGVKPRLPIDLADAGDCDTADLDAEARTERAIQFAEGLQSQRKTAQENITAAQSKQKIRYDLKHAPPIYKVGDKVLKYNRRRDTHKGDKLKPRYTGPYVICDVLGRGVYRLKDGDKVLTQAANATNLKLWRDRSPPSSPTGSSGARSPTDVSPTGSRTPPAYDSRTASSHQRSSPVDLTADAPVSPTSPAKTWVAELRLTEDDKSQLVGGEWLSDKIVDAVNTIIAQHLGTDAPQTSVLSQSPAGFAAVATDTMQVMYDWSHWVATACVHGDVYVANSLSDKDQVSEMVRKQLKQLYASAVDEHGGLHATLVSCVQQTNGSDCGVFAAAFLFEWATSSVHTSLNVQFDVPKMRPHLARCLESLRVLPFPKIPCTRRGKRGQLRKLLL